MRASKWAGEFNMMLPHNIILIPFPSGLPWHRWWTTYLVTTNHQFRNPQRVQCIGPIHDLGGAWWGGVSYDWVQDIRSLPQRICKSWPLTTWKRHLRRDSSQILTGAWILDHTSWTKATPNVCNRWVHWVFEILALKACPKQISQWKADWSTGPWVFYALSWWFSLTRPHLWGLPSGYLT